MNTRVWNPKRLVVLVVLTMVGSAGILALHRFQIGRIARVLRERAAAFEAKGELNAAVEELSRYLTLRPGDLEADVTHAELLARSSRTPAGRDRAYRTYDRLVRRLPGRRDLRRTLADLAMELGRYADARPHLKVLNLEGSSDGVLEELLGRCDEAEGDLASASRWYEAACRIAPGRPLASFRLARLRRGPLHDPEGADRAADAVVKASPDDPLAWLERSRYRRDFGISGADEDLGRARTLAPDSPEVLLEVARTAPPTTARAALDRAEASRPDDPRICRERATLELREGKPDAALERLKRCLAATPASLELRWSLACLMAERGDVRELQEQIERLEAGLPALAPPAIDYLRGWLHVNQGRYEPASRLLERSQGSPAAWPELRAKANELLARCQAKLGRPGRQAEALVRAAGSDPRSDEARLGLAASLAGQGRTDRAIAEYRALAGEVAAARAPLARLLIARNAQIAEENRHWDEVERLIADLEKASGDPVPAVVLRAEYLATRGRLDEARKALDLARTNQPSRPELAVARAALERQAAGPKAALEVLAEGAKTLGDRPEIRLERYRTLAGGGVPGALDLLRNEANALTTIPAGDRTPLLRGLADALARTGDEAAASRLWTEVAAADPGDAGVRLVLFDHALRQGEAPADLARRIEEIRKIEGEDGTLWRFADARLAALGDADAIKSARETLDDLARRRPEWAAVPLALAELDERAGRPRAAADHYVRAVELGLDHPVVLARGVTLLVGLGRLEPADRLLRRQASIGALPASLAPVAIDVALTLGDPARALSLARRETQTRPELPDSWLGLAKALSAGPSPDAAAIEGAFRRAVAVAPARAEARLALLRWYAERGDAPRAEAEWNALKAEVAPETRAEALALGAEALGRFDAARDVFRDGLKARPDDANLAWSWALFLARRGPVNEAIPTLRDWAGRAETPADRRSLSRRLLGLLLATRGNHAGAREALEWLSGVTIDSSPEDLRALAVALEATRGLRERREAIRLLEGLGDALGDEDRVRLAVLYDAVGERARARAALRGLAARAAIGAGSLLKIIELSPRLDRTEEAATAIARLEKMTGGEAPAALWKARLLHERGDRDAARTLLVERVQAGVVGPSAAAGRLDELGELDLAEALYREAATRAERPAARLELAEFLARRGRPAEALAICERAWRDSAPLDVARVGVRALGMPGPEGDDLAAAERLAVAIAAASAKDPKSAGLITCLGCVREVQGRFADAEADYRRALAIDPDEPVALNNLALLLALRGGDKAGALALVNRAIDRVGPLPDLLDTRGVVRLASGDAAGALADLTESALGRPAPLTDYHLAQVHLRAGRADDALRAYQRMREQLHLDPAARRQIDAEETLLPGALRRLERLASAGR